MKKLVYLLSMMAICVFTFEANAQTLVTFKLSPTGYFVSEVGEDYVVVAFENKTAHELFQQVYSKANSMYKDPQKVVSVVDDASITINGYDSQLTYRKDLVQKFWLGGNYNLNFHFKDGRIKVDAPKFGDTLYMTVNGSRDHSFYRMVKSWYKDGEVKSKFKEQVTYTENNINAIVNELLGLFDKNTDDW